MKWSIQRVIEQFEEEALLFESEGLEKEAKTIRAYSLFFKSVQDAVEGILGKIRRPGIVREIDMQHMAPQRHAN